VVEPAGLEQLATARIGTQECGSILMRDIPHMTGAAILQLL